MWNPFTKLKEKRIKKNEALYDEAYTDGANAVIARHCAMIYLAEDKGFIKADNGFSTVYSALNYVLDNHYNEFRSESDKFLKMIMHNINE
jgi:hypothetical protein